MRLKIISIVICLFALSLPVVLSFWQTFNAKIEWEEVLLSDASDVDMVEIQTIIDGFDGFGYYHNLISSDIKVLLIYILTLLVGILFGSVFFDDIKNGVGNMILGRVKLKNYLMKRNIYIFLNVFLIVTIVNFLILFIAYSLFGLTSNVTGGSYTILEISTININSLWGQLLYTFMYSITISFLIFFYLMISINLFTSLASNRYFLMISPFIMLLIPSTLFSIIGNIFISLQSIIYFLGFETIYNYLFFDGNNYLVESIIYFVFMLCVFIVSFALVQDRLKKNYL